MKRKSFTLVEILVVIAIITILMGLLFPALGMVKERAYMRQSLSDVKAIHMAIKSFKNDYGYLPFDNPSSPPSTTKDLVYYGAVAKNDDTDPSTKVKCNDIFKSDSSLTLQNDYIDFFSALCYLKPTGSIAATGGTDRDKNPREVNSKKVRFLTPIAKYSKYGGYLDPWGRPYVVFLDTNYDGEITLPGNIKIYDDAAIVGLGTYTPKDNNTTLKEALEDKNASQIVTSWK